MKKGIISDLSIIFIYTVGFITMLTMAVLAFVSYNKNDNPKFWLSIGIELLVGILLIGFWVMYSGSRDKLSIPISYVLNEINKLKSESDSLDKSRVIELAKARSLMITAYDYEILLKEYADKNNISLKTIDQYTEKIDRIHNSY